MARLGFGVAPVIKAGMALNCRNAGRSFEGRSMASTCDLIVNGKRVRARIGDTVLTAALMGGIALPNDCNTGQCETCRVRLYAGEVDDQGSRRGDTVLACQATLSGEAVVEFDEVPEPKKISGTVGSVVQI